ncbi:hypothetical protein BGZ60DRAFT_533768 [Tricladium varicosporioides]|nr:hypothetical protein BGZ60DRAFT_533768 [Hymenoscyphus varicosporioides]
MSTKGLPEVGVSNTELGPILACGLRRGITTGNAIKAHLFWVQAAVVVAGGVVGGNMANTPRLRLGNLRNGRWSTWRFRMRYGSSAMQRCHAEFWSDDEVRNIYVAHIRAFLITSVPAYSLRVRSLECIVKPLACEVGVPSLRFMAARCGRSVSLMPWCHE